VLWVGRLDEWKRRRCSCGPAGAEARAVFVAVVPRKKSCAGSRAELGVAERVRFAGQVDDEALLASRRGPHRRGHRRGRRPRLRSARGVSVGKAVLTTEDAGGPLEFVKDGETGIVTAPRPEALGVALRLAWSRPDALRAMGEAGRARAALLDWDGPVRALLAAAGLS
jgi:glycosyltransferase involved in cell wall biosynthesis